MSQMQYDSVGSIIKQAVKWAKVFYPHEHKCLANCLPTVGKHTLNTISGLFFLLLNSLPWLPCLWLQV